MKKKSSFLPTLILFGSGILAGGFAGFVLLFLTPGEWGFLPTMLQLLLILPAILLQTILHEGGHLVCGLATGYQFSSFRIFSFVWMKEDGRIVLRHFRLAGTGGQCILAPPDSEDGRIPTVLYLLGGVLSNLLFSFIGALLLIPFHTVPVLSVFLAFFSTFGLFLAATNGIPLNTGMVDNDGANVRILLRRPQASRSLWVQLKIQEQISRGIRLREMPEEWFTLPEEDGLHNSLEAAVAVFAANRLMDAHRFEDADALMDRLCREADGMAGIHRQLLLVDRLYLEAITQNRPEVLNRMLTQDLKTFLKQMAANPSAIRVQYTMALLSEHDPKKAEKLLQDFERCAASYPYPSEIQGERELLEIANAKAEVNLSA